MALHMGIHPRTYTRTTKVRMYLGAEKKIGQWDPKDCVTSTWSGTLKLLREWLLSKNLK